MRSVNVERDFMNPQSLAGYVLSDFARDSLVRITEDIKSDKGCRAWRITGDYGAGKSSFALLLATVLSGNANELPNPLKEKFAKKIRIWNKAPLLPVLVTGSRESLGKAILRGLKDAVERSYSRQPRSREYAELCTALEAPSLGGDRVVLDLIRQVTKRLITDGRASGIVLVIDEMGKFLEHDLYAAEGHDVYLLQQLAEAASRSGSSTFAVVGVLHLGMSSYTRQLGATEEKEWQKIGGRFQEVVFSQPLRDVAELLASALNVAVDNLPPETKMTAQKCMAAAIDMGLFGPAATTHLQTLAPSFFPISPALLPILVRLLHRYGQNERSVLSFAMASEPFGLQDYAAKNLVGDNFYSAYDLYDYVRANLSHHLLLDKPPNRWSLIDSLVQQHAHGTKLETDVLKTVGLLNLLDTNDLLATENAITWLVGGPNEHARDQVGLAIKKLCNETGILHYRGLGGGYCLWPHTSVDIDGLYSDVLIKLGSVSKVSQQLPTFLDNKPIVARRHYIETGNLRYFEIRYCRVDRIAEQASMVDVDADGLVLVPLPDTAQEAKAASDAVESLAVKDARVIVAVVPPLKKLASQLEEARCWEWVLKNASALNSDPFARQEVARHRNSSRQRLNDAVGDLVNLRQGCGVMPIRWFWQGKEKKVNNGRELLSLLSTVCDKVYSMGPRIQNELINRRKPSSVATAARSRLISSILSSSKEKLLGMAEDKKPPEMSIYLSVLAKGGIHILHEGRWCLVPPSENDPCNLLPAFKCIDEVLHVQQDDRVRVDAILTKLKNHPYGVRDGFMPLLLTIYYAIHKDEIAIYEDGTFIPEIDERDFQRLTKEPDAFEFQFCDVDGVRSDVFKTLASSLELPDADAKKDRILSVVTSLCVFVEKLPKYALQTRRLSKDTMAVRNSIREARDPVKLLFTELPEACGCSPIKSYLSTSKQDFDLFAAALRSALDELRFAFVKLRDRMAGVIDENFALSGTLALKRVVIQSRVQSIQAHVLEPRLRAFCLRLGDSALADDKWLESVGTLVVQKPPHNWQDDDEASFNREFYFYAASFKRMERFDFKKAKDGSQALRLAITKDTGEEVEEIIHISRETVQQSNILEKQVKSILENHPGIGLAVLSSALCKYLESGQKKRPDSPTREMV